MQRIVLVSIVSTLMLLASAQLARANVIRWDLQNVTFDDGAVATGFFLLDADVRNNVGLILSGALKGWDITVEGGTMGCCALPPDYRFSSTLEPSNGYAVAPDPSRPEDKLLIFYSHLFLDRDPLGRLALQLQLYFFDPPLSDDGGRSTLEGVEESTYDAVWGPRFIATGEVVGAIPEPTEPIFLSLGLCATAIAVRRKVSTLSREALPLRFLERGNRRTMHNSDYGQMAHSGPS